MVAPTASVVGTEMEAMLIILGRSGVVQVAFACGINNAAVPRTSKKKHCLIICIIVSLNGGSVTLRGSVNDAGLLFLIR